MSKKLFIFVVLSLSACVVGPDYKTPEVKTPDSWVSADKFKEEQPKISENVDQKWWKNFNDPVLDQIIEMVIENNLDLKIAQSKIIEARTNISKEESYLAPQITAESSGTRNSKYFNPVNPNRRKPITLYDAGFDASWEIDLFGGVQRAKESFWALFEAAREDKNSIQISLIGEAVRNYIQLRGLQDQIALHKKIADALKQVLELSEARNNAGLISDIDLVKTRTDLLNEKALLPDLDASLTSAALRIEILAGKNPGELKELLQAKTFSSLQIDKDVIINAPVNIIRNRPDIKEAERNLASATALEGVAISERYPKISLTGFFGFQSTNSGNLFKRSSKAFTLGSAVSLPIFDFGGIESDIKVARAKKEQALLTYKSSILGALEDVENALTSYANNQDKLRIGINNLKVNNLSAELSEDKYKNGLISLPDLLTSKVNLYRVHNSLIQNQTDLNISLVTLYKALGGGWEDTKQN